MYAPLLSHVRATCSAHLSLLDLITCINLFYVTVDLSDYKAVNCRMSYGLQIILNKLQDVLWTTNHLK
jgi:hypothetical protein